MRIRGDHVAGLAHHRKQDALGRPPLVRGDHVAEAGEIVGRALEPEEALAPGIRFIAAHQRGPLFGGHGAGSRIGQQVDQDVTRRDAEQVIAGLFEVAFALLAGSLPQRLDALDAERLDDGVHVGDYRADSGRSSPWSKNSPRRRGGAEIARRKRL